VWATWSEVTLPDSKGSLYRGTRRAVRLDDPSRQEVYYFDKVTLGSTGVYLWKVTPADPDAGTPGSTRVTIHRLGDEPLNDYEQTFEGDDGLLQAAGGDKVLLWWRADASTTALDVRSTDGFFARTIPLPEGVDPATPPDKLGLYFVQNGTLLFTRGPDKELRRWVTEEFPSSTNPALRTDGTLGKRPPIAAVDDSVQTFLTCSMDDGLRGVKYDGSADKVYDPSPCTSIVTFAGRLMYYRAQGELRTIPLDGDNRYSVITLPVARIWSFGREGQMVYTRTPGDQFIEGVGDGWLGDWNFMFRGADAVMTADGKKMHWIENAAKLGAIGDCMWSPIPAPGEPSPTPIRLARNCAGYELQSDGRVMLFENSAFRGQFNRLVIADEEAGQKRWVAEGAQDYVRIPGSTDLLLLRWSPIGNDVVRIQVPEK
jgi:hypothetical protein